MRRFVCVAFVLAALCAPGKVLAEEGFLPTRVRLVVHGGHEISDRLRLELRFVPAENLVAGRLAPLLYFGPVYKITDSFTLEGGVGWASSSDEPLLSVAPSLKIGPVWSWLSVDLELPSNQGYWFWQIEFDILPWLAVGGEGEGWGSFMQAVTWSNGGGPNVLVKLGGAGFDFAFHVRAPAVGISPKPELFFRVHLFL